VFNLYDNWPRIQEALWSLGLEQLKARYDSHPDADDVKTYLSNLKKYDDPNNPRDILSFMAPGALEHARGGVSQSSNWCQALARFRLRYRVGTMRLP
jgi:hypothetical protein